MTTKEAFQIVISAIENPALFEEEYRWYKEYGAEDAVRLIKGELTEDELIDSKEDYYWYYGY